MTDLTILWIDDFRLAGGFIQTEDIHGTSVDTGAAADAFVCINFFYWHFIFTPLHKKNFAYGKDPQVRGSLHKVFG